MILEKISWVVVAVVVVVVAAEYCPSAYPHDAKMMMQTQQTTIEMIPMNQTYSLHVLVSAVVVNVVDYC